MARPDLHVMILESLRNLKSTVGPAQIRSAIFNHFLENRRYIKPARARSLSESFQRRLYASKVNAVQSFRNLFLDHFVPCVGVLKRILAEGMSVISEEALPSAGTSTGAAPAAGNLKQDMAGGQAVDPKSLSSSQVAGKGIASDANKSPEELMNDIEDADAGEQEIQNKEREEAILKLGELQKRTDQVQKGIESNAQINQEYSDDSKEQIDLLASDLAALNDAQTQSGVDN